MKTLQIAHFESTAAATAARMIWGKCPVSSTPEPGTSPRRAQASSAGGGLQSAAARKLRAASSRSFNWPAALPRLTHARGYAGESVHARLRQAAQEFGVAPDASDTDVRAAYKALARRWHPDRARELEGGAPTEAATDKFKEMKAAYDMLTSMTAEARAAAVAKAKKRAQQQFAPTPAVPAAPDLPPCRPAFCVVKYVDAPRGRGRSAPTRTSSPCSAT